MGNKFTALGWYCRGPLSVELLEVELNERPGPYVKSSEDQEFDRAFAEIVERAEARIQEAYRRIADIRAQQRSSTNLP
jgi:hypothetical protein